MMASASEVTERQPYDGAGHARKSEWTISNASPACLCPAVKSIGQSKFSSNSEFRAASSKHSKQGHKEISKERRKALRLRVPRKQCWLVYDDHAVKACRFSRFTFDSDLDGSKASAALLFRFRTLVHTCFACLLSFPSIPGRASVA